MSVLATTLLAAVPATAPPVHPVLQDEELFTFWIADLETFFADPKDAGLLRALKLVDDRVLELPDEIPGFEIPVPPEVIELCLHLLTGEKSVRILSSTDPDLMFPVYGQLEFMEGSPERAQAVAEMIMQLAQGAGAPISQSETGLASIDGAPVPVLFGARGSEVVLSAGKLIDAPINTTSTDLPAGVPPSLILNLNIGGCVRVAEMLAGGDRDVAEIMEILKAIGLADMEFRIASGSDADRSYTTVRMPNMAGAMRDGGMLASRGLNAGDLALVPQDAVWASVSTVNFQGTLDFILELVAEPLAAEGIEDPIEMLHGMTGFHLQADLVEHLGETWGFYTSDTTGGGGLLSAVMFMELSNSDGLLDTTERAQDIINGLADAEAEGYVELRTWEDAGVTYITLTFPGLPIPAEPTIAFTQSHLFAALTASSCRAAVAQATTDGPNLMHHPRFVENLPGSVDGSYSVSFFDTPRMIQDGYGLTNLLMSALVNGTRSRTDATRNAGIIMPSFHELRAGAKASVGVTRIEGNDFISEYRGDRSVLVNTTSTVGFIVNTPILLAIPAAFLWAAESESEAMYFEETDWEYEDKEDY